MSDLAKWKVHGPVKTLKTEFAEWDLSQSEWGGWGPARRFTFCTFRSDGNIIQGDFHNPDGSIAHSRYLYSEGGQLLETHFWINDGPPQKSLYSYDDAERHIRTVQVNQDGVQRETEACSYDKTGRKTKVCFLPPQNPGIAQGYSIDGAGDGYVIPGPGATTMTIHYDERHQSIDGLFHDADRNLISQVVFVRDSDGRLLSEEMYLGEQGRFPDLKKRLEGMSTEDKKRATAFLNQLSSPTQAFKRTNYEYDPNGRMISRSRLMATLSNERSTFRYDDHGNPIEETMEGNSRDARIDENGELRSATENTRK